MKCIGLFGYFFGHKYEGIYDKTKEQLTVEEKILLAEKADKLSEEYDYYTDISTTLIDAINTSKNSSTNYIYHICNRCGDIKNKL